MTNAEKKKIWRSQRILISLRFFNSEPSHIQNTCLATDLVDGRPSTVEGYRIPLFNEQALQISENYASTDQFTGKLIARDQHTATRKILEFFMWIKCLPMLSLEFF